MGFTEMIVLAAIALIVIGPKQLPELARVLASLVNELKRATTDLRESLTQVKSDVDKAVRDVESSVVDPEQWIKNQAKKVLEEREKGEQGLAGVKDLTEGVSVPTEEKKNSSDEGS